MKKKLLLKEQQRWKLLENSGINGVNGANLFSVDIQPEYQDYFNFDIFSYLAYLNGNYNSMNSLTFLYNGSDTLGMIIDHDYKFWLLDNGLDESIVETAKFYDKGYAFFRYCMDSSIDDEEIINLVRYMIKYQINDSRDIDEEMWLNFMEEYGYESSEIKDLLENAGDMINIPELMDYLRNYGGKIVLCGGGINECLKEVEIALMALNKNYNVLTEFTY